MKHFDLFSGYGGFTLALERVYADNNMGRITSSSDTKDRWDMPLSESGDGNGWRTNSDTIGFSEIDKYASAVLKYHWPNIKNYGDIKSINWAEVPDFDLLTGGSPCQDLSIAGKRAGLEGARSGLFYEYMRAVKEKRPKYFIWENVKGALSSNKGFDFAAVLNEMAEAGYALWWQVLNAKDFGVPQNRERIFVIGFRDGSSREIFFEREGGAVNSGQDGQGNAYCLQAGNDKHRGTYVKGDILQGVSDERPTIRQLNNPTQRGSEHKKYIPLSEDKANCITTSQADIFKWVFNKSKIRRLTPTECERLMGLPDDWTSAGGTISDSQRYKLCGNGVVVNVVEALLKELILSLPT